MATAGITMRPPARIKKLEQGEMRLQCSACFINSVGDIRLEGILDLAKTGRHAVLKWGSGHGHQSVRRLREEDGLAVERRKGFRPAKLHEGFRRLRWRDQERQARHGGARAKMVILNA